MWKVAVEKVLTTIARSLASRIYRLARKKLGKEFLVSEIAEALEKGKLSFDKIFSVRGTFSEYLPFVDFATLIRTDIKSETIGTCRIGDLVRSNTYLGALFPLGTKKATDPAIPIIYSSIGKSRKIFSFSTGDQLKLECRLVPLDYEFRGILHRKEYFCFEEKPFGLEILDVYTKKPKKVDEFVIDAFFLTSLEYEGGADNFFSLLNEISDILYEETEFAIPITLQIELHRLAREGKVGAKVVRSERGRESVAYHDWIDERLHRISHPVDVLDSEGSKALVDELIDHIANYSFAEKSVIDDWASIKTLFQSKITGYQKKVLSETKELAHIARKLRNRSDLLKAWNFYLEPKLNIDFQFDQVCPIAKQTIDPRVILKQRGFT